MADESRERWTKSVIKLAKNLGRRAEVLSPTCSQKLFISEMNAIHSFRSLNSQGPCASQ